MAYHLLLDKRAYHLLRDPIGNFMISKEGVLTRSDGFRMHVSIKHSTMESMEEQIL